MNIEQALEIAYDDIAKSATDPNTNFSQNMKAMFEKQNRQKAWEKTYANFALEGIYPSEEMERIGKLYIDGKISLEQQGDMMRKAILQKRQKAWTKAMRTSALERIYPSPELTALGERYINGEITIEQAIKIYKNQL